MSYIRQCHEEEMRSTICEDCYDYDAIYEDETDEDEEEE